MSENKNQKNKMSIKLPELGQHLVFCGTTGSGKSYFAKKLLEKFDRFFIFDTHNSFTTKAYILNSPEFLTSKLLLFNRIRYIPKLDYRSKQFFNYVIKKLVVDNSGKKRIIYIDEIFHLGFGANFPDWLSRGISTARQRKTSFWVASQRPSNIPMAVLTEATKIYCFYLSYEEDINKLALFVRDTKNFKEAMKELKYDYSFIEIDRIKGIWKKYPKLEV